jgi:hypothetical protein
MGYESYFRKRQSQAEKIQYCHLSKIHTGWVTQHKIATESFLDLLKKLENASKFKISIIPNRACRFISHKNGSDADSCVTPVF